MTEIDLFGFKFGKDEVRSTNEKRLDNYSREVTYEIPKTLLIEKLGLTGKKITFISYDYNSQKLTIKAKEDKQPEYLDKESKQELKESINSAFGAGIIK